MEAKAIKKRGREKSKEKEKRENKKGRNKKKILEFFWILKSKSILNFANYF